MNFNFCPLQESDKIALLNLFNYYVENSYAAFPENRVGDDFFSHMMQLSLSYPVITVKPSTGELIGFALLRPYSPIAVFKRTAEIAYFLAPDHTAQGIGRALLEYLTAEARKRRIDSLIATISSSNDTSIKFHNRSGFKECGRLQNIGRKFERDFDVLLMQKQL